MSNVSAHEPPGKSEGVAAPVRQRRPDKNEFFMAYIFLRNTVGWIGSLLSIVLIVGNLSFHEHATGLHERLHSHMQRLRRHAVRVRRLSRGAYTGYDHVDRWIGVAP